MARQVCGLDDLVFPRCPPRGEVRAEQGEQGGPDLVMGHSNSVLYCATAEHSVRKCVEVATEGTEGAGLKADPHPPVVAGVNSPKTLKESSFFFSWHLAQSLPKVLLPPGVGKKTSAKEAILHREAGFSGSGVGGFEEAGEARNGLALVCVGCKFGA